MVSVEGKISSAAAKPLSSLGLHYLVLAHQETDDQKLPRFGLDPVMPASQAGFARWLIGHVHERPRVMEDTVVREQTSPPDVQIAFVHRSAKHLSAS